MWLLLNYRLAYAVAGCTALVWFMSILPTLLTNAPLDIIEINTTEPTFIIDLAAIAEGAAHQDAVAAFNTDANFEAWFADLTSQLNEAAGQ